MLALWRRRCHWNPSPLQRTTISFENRIRSCQWRFTCDEWQSKHIHIIRNQNDINFREVDNFIERCIEFRRWIDKNAIATFLQFGIGLRIVITWTNPIGQRLESRALHQRQWQKIQHRLAGQSAIEHNQQLLEADQVAWLGRITAQTILQ